MPSPTLKLGPLPDRTPVKLTLAIDPNLQDDLAAYARVHERLHGKAEPVTALVPAMLEAFLASDSGFKRLRREL